jgi:hypothetical protein
MLIGKNKMPNEEPPNNNHPIIPVENEAAGAKNCDGNTEDLPEQRETPTKHCSSELLEEMNDEATSSADSIGGKEDQPQNGDLDDPNAIDDELLDLLTPRINRSMLISDKQQVDGICAMISQNEEGSK